MKTAITTLFISLIVFLVTACCDNVESHVKAFCCLPAFVTFVGSMIYIIINHDKD